MVSERTRDEVNVPIMYKLTAVFNEHPLELTCLKTFDVALGSRRFLRGKTDGAFTCDGTFQWTVAVKAFSYLLLLAKTSGIANAKISGDRGSYAAALDYALSKPPRWLQEIFGGKDKVQRHFKRTNPERKNPGPVVIGLNPHKFSDASITIITDGQELKEACAVRALADRLVSKNTFSYSPSQNPAPISAVARASELLGKSLGAEIHSSLYRADLLTKMGITRHLKELQDHSQVSSRLEDSTKILQSFSYEGSSSYGCGIISKEQDALLRAETTTFIASAVSPGMLSLAEYLRVKKGYPIKIDFHSSYGVEVAAKMRTYRDHPGPIIAGTGVGPTFDFLNNTKLGFSPLMLGPLLSHRVLAYGDNSDQKQIKGELFVVDDLPTSSLFYRHKLFETGLLNKQNVIAVHRQPEEVTSLARERQDFYSLMWYPHYLFHSDILGAKVSMGPAGFSSTELYLVLCNERVSKDRPLFNAYRAALRSAWIALLENPSDLTEIATSLLTKDYQSYLTRCAGIFLLGNSPALPQAGPLTLRKSC